MKKNLFIFLMLFVMVSAFANPVCRCLPSEKCWPTAEAWKTFGESLTGKLVQPRSTMHACRDSVTSPACQEALTKMKNPFIVDANPGDPMSQGWLNAWQFHQSIYAVEAENQDDIVKAVNFAREHNLRLVIKGAGHDYLGRNTAPDSLLIWTGKMRDVTYDPAFVPEGCSKKHVFKGVHAKAGARWLETYGTAADHGRYVQGGGCTTVGSAGGFIQGGGFGPFSKKFGVASGDVLQFSVVTPDGEVRVANQCQNKALFWALKGGGGSTYGVVSEVVLRSFPLPHYFGLITGKIKADSDESYQKLIRQFVHFYNESMSNEHWGEQVRFAPDNTLGLTLVYEGESKANVENDWAPFAKWVKEHADHYKDESTLVSIPNNKLFNMDYWLANFPDYIRVNHAPDARKGEYWWASNSEELHRFWYTYQSWWIPQRLFTPTHEKHFSQVLFEASRIYPYSLHFNKGQAGAAKEARLRDRKIAMNPKVLDAAALLIISAGTDKAYPGYEGLPQVPNSAKKEVNRIQKVIALFEKIAPEAGTYGNEADYFQPHWQKVFWGSNYDRLLALKKQYDPNGLLYCHHCVGSEMWKKGGFCPA